MALARPRPARSWPLLALAAPAAVAVWSGWVGIGQMTGFGQIHPLPGIWDSLHLDTAVTLPIGVEAYATFALRVWLTRSAAISDRTRRFARRSAIAALVLGMAGQVAYHLLAQAGVSRAPWEVTTVVACLPVLVLGMGSALAHLLRSDAAAAPLADQSAWQYSVGRAADRGNDVRRLPARARIPDAYAAAAKIMASGQRVSRRSLRSAGLRGSNAELGAIARLIKNRPQAGQESLCARAHTTIPRWCRRTTELQRPTFDSMHSGS
jgi:hypothetical protein